MNAYLYRNSILFSKKQITAEIGNLKKEKISHFFSLFDATLPFLKVNNVIFIGWAWDCSEGRKIAGDDLSVLTFENITEKMKDFAGRFVIILDSKYLFTDATSLFPIYYTHEMFSTNISLLCHVNELEIKSAIAYRKKLILPPSTGVRGVKRLIPGEFLDLDTMTAHTIGGYLRLDQSSNDINLQVNKVAQHLINSGKGLAKICNSDYRLMFTGGKDSRLSFLALYKTELNSIKTVTHSKPFFFNSAHDINAPKEISRRLNFSHQITVAHPATSKLNLPTLHNHAPYLSFSNGPGSTYYYYTHGNWEQIQECFLIDNYYEIGRMHLHGKGAIGNSTGLTHSLLIENDYIIDAEDFLALEQHLKKTSRLGVDFLDSFYFVKNFVNVANQFEMIDYLHNPLVYCNSLSLFRLLLSVPDAFRSNGKFHALLIDSINIPSISHIPCNPGAKTFQARLMSKIKRVIIPKLYDFTHRE